MKILFTICGRAGSKGIKNKNIREFNGRPLVYYTLSAIYLFLMNNKAYSMDIALNTDSKKLQELVKQYRKLDVYFIPRKPHLATDKVAKRDVIIDTVVEMERIKKYHYDLVVDLDITSPLRTLSDLLSAIDKQLQTNADVVFSVTVSRRNPYFNMIKKNNEKGYCKVLESSFTTRQEAPDIYDMNASIYVYKASHLLNGRGVFEGYNEVIVMKDTGVLDLDNENDFGLMEVLTRYLVERDDEFRHIYNNTME